MFRTDFWLLIPCLIIALYQVKIIWAGQPKYDFKETEIGGEYSDFQKSNFGLLQKLIECFFVLQLMVEVLPISDAMAIKLVGYILIIIGFFISQSALRSLGNNWSGMYEYRIKMHQKLVISGIYSYVRHPIYLAIILESVGYELVANSWLFIVALVVSLILFSRHITKEELLLKEKYKNEFVIYANRTSKLIPFVY